MTLEEHKAAVKRLYPLSGYFERYFELLPLFGSGHEAYSAIEREFHALFGCNRYNSYESFKVTKRRYILSLRNRRNR